MGTKNRQRRAAKAKDRARKRAQGAGSRTGGFPWGDGPGGAAGDPSGWAPPPGGAGRASDEEARLLAWLELTILARETNDTQKLDIALANLARSRPESVALTIERLLAGLFPALWAAGWLPGEVLRQARRTTSAAGERLAAVAIATDHLSRPHQHYHPRWLLHLDQLDLPSNAGPGWLRRMLASEQAAASSSSLTWPALIELSTAAIFTLGRLGSLTVIIPPPGSPAAVNSIVDLASQASAHPVLTKVRQLLAQAESTTFDAEAEAFTAKAQELMARHAIDAALVWDQQRHDNPVTIRVPIDDPYFDAKSLLITIVAEESQCKAVISSHNALATLVGFETDLVWCETLYTSLLVQAQRELARAGADSEAGSRRRSRSFRSSFLFAYANRIGERLAEVNDHVRADAETHTANANEANGGPEAGLGATSGLLPVLARRRSAVEDEVAELFPSLGTQSVRVGRDHLGWAEGRMAADRAELTRGDLAAPTS